MSEVTLANIAEPLYQVKLLAALRSGDVPAIHQLLSEIGKDKRKASEDDVDIGAAALHLAIRCASCETVQLLLLHRSISPNAVYPRGSGTTPLHLAASIGRGDVVNLLLEQDGIDDTLRDSQGRTCKEVARGKEVQKIIRDSRSLLTASYRSLLHSYTASSPSQAAPQSLINLLHSPRARLVDLSYLDPTTGRSLLHEAARRKNLSLIDLSIRAGADVFVRDRRGKGVGEGGGGTKDDKVRVFLRQFTNQDTSLLDQPSSSSEPPALKGYLSKYTNVAKGYNTRWFVLRNGILSYYRHQDDENIASRGSIAMKSAMLRFNNHSDKLRFEIHSTPSRGYSSSGQQKWYMKGNHAVEVNRWTQALARNIEYYKRDNSAQSGSDTDGRSLKSLGSSLRTSTNSFILPKKRLGNLDVSKSSASSLNEMGEDRESRDLRGPSEQELGVGVGQAAVEESERDESEECLADDSSAALSERAPPHEATFSLHGNTTAAQADLTAQLLASLAFLPNSAQTLHEVRQALEESATTTQRMMGEYVRMVAEREEWWKERLERERARGALWEESLQVVVREGEALEHELKSRMRRRSKVPTEGAETGRSTLTSRRRSGLVAGMFSPSPFALEQPPASKSGLPVASSSDVPFTQESAATAQEMVQSPPVASVPVSPHARADTESMADTDEEDEFFDAIESNLLPNVVVPDALVAKPSGSICNTDGLPPSISLDQYIGYEHLRERLPIESDTRPPTSLWSVLKHSIGKDLTKISFPVFFNEPTSMLQRMAEDMEFSECLDAACAESDPLKRIAFVAAFAMSNYSSTIGRIAKPFNPMLSETFEYVRLDKKYRYMSEQVSHHPPISACWAESPTWHYFGEVDAQNKFMGKSFEIRPTGVAHAELLIPEKFVGDDYPKAKGPMGQGKVVEHYSWKKVTTNVSGFILGSPTIDHYGEMTVYNHRTGDTCVLTFKPRGWRGRDAFEIMGSVMDTNGNTTHEIAGRWNGQLVARPVGTGFGILHPDVKVNTPASPSSSTEYILLWRNTVKPPAPFNLTPFAITLNDLPEKTLKPVICPTDCRLRPDQRAFELGKYERANELKQKQEEHQRATRRAREEGRKETHRPRWFEARVEPETGERVWEPRRTDTGDLAYWKEREAVWREGRPWKDVEKIFIDDEP